MIKLKLETKNKAEEQVLEYLQKIVSETLADKINNGVKITKDNKILLNRKTLSGFMKYACEEAKKQAEQGANSACIEDEVVFGWAIHYFEEDCIEGQLFNEDGTEYKVEKPKIETRPTPKLRPKKPENKQATLFDLITDETEKVEEDDDEEVAEIEKEYEEQKVNPTQGHIKVVETKDDNVVVDTNTGEILSKEQIQQSFDKETMYMLYTLLEGKMDIR